MVKENRIVDILPRWIPRHRPCELQQAGNDLAVSLAQREQARLDVVHAWQMPGEHVQEWTIPITIAGTEQHAAS